MSTLHVPRFLEGSGERLALGGGAGGAKGRYRDEDAASGLGGVVRVSYERVPHQQEVLMKMMFLSSLFLTAGASGFVLAEVGLSEMSMILASFIGGTFGFGSFYGQYGDEFKTIKQMARHALAAVPTGNP